MCYASVSKPGPALEVAFPLTPLPIFWVIYREREIRELLITYPHTFLILASQKKNIFSDVEIVDLGSLTKASTFMMGPML